MKCMDFSCALKVLKLGKRIQRESHQEVFYYIKDTTVYIRSAKDTTYPRIEDFTALFTSEEVLATDWAVVIDSPPIA